MISTGVPGFGVDPESGHLITGGGAHTTLMHGPAAPAGFRPIFLLENNVEVYRSPLGFQEDINIAIGITFDQGQVDEGQPVVETLQQYADLVERILAIIENHAF